MWYMTMRWVWSCDTWPWGGCGHVIHVTMAQVWLCRTVQYCAEAEFQVIDRAISTLVLMILWGFEVLKPVFWWFLWMNNSATEKDTTKIVTSFRSESTAHYNDINISCYEKIPKIGENALIIDLPFCQKFVIFAKFIKHQTIHISRLTILS